MKRLKHLTIAAAVTAAFAVPAALAQQSGAPDPSASRTQQRDAAGFPANSPTQRQMGDRGTVSDPTLRSDRMHQGQYGSDTVRSAQQALQDKGFDVGGVDGVMGPRTESALRQFQQQNGISGSGRLDSRTLNALNVSAAGGMSDRSGARTGNPGSGAIGSSPAGSGTPPSSSTSDSGRAPANRTVERPQGPASTGNPGSGTIGTSPSGSGAPPASGSSNRGG
jgi:peptidoglycan hydrolase-like protein with peptidoglycan-binding domain